MSDTELEVITRIIKFENNATYRIDTTQFIQFEFLKINNDYRYLVILAIIQSGEMSYAKIERLALYSRSI